MKKRIILSMAKNAVWSENTNVGLIIKLSDDVTQRKKSYVSITPHF